MVATGGNPSQIGPPRNPQTYAKTVAGGCDLLPESFHGKEGVDGSSPSEGFAKKALQMGFFVLPSMARLRRSAGTRRVHFAERFIQTLLAEWAYARRYPSSSERARAVRGYLRWYNKRRPHSSLGARPPISRISHLCGHDS